MPKTVRAVIFDLDDTLVMSSVDYAKFKALVIERIGSYGDDKSLYSPNETIVAILGRFEDRMRRQGVSDEEISRRLGELDKIMDAVELERVSDTIAITGSLELLRLLKAKHVKIGILTRGCDEYATRVLSMTGMLPMVDAIECRNSRMKPKPNPESYLRLVDALGVRKEETIFVGDHPIDAQCAANAGVAFVAVETGDVPSDTLRAAGSIEVFRDVGHIVPWFEKLLHS
ncbi:MAG: HAD family hydrolase [Thermoplasmata archaeon]